MLDPDGMQLLCVYPGDPASLQLTVSPRISLLSQGHKWLMYRYPYLQTLQSRSQVHTLLMSPSPIMDELTKARTVTFKFLP